MTIVQRWLILALVAIVLGLGIWIGIQKIELAHKNATIISQETSIKNLTRANEIMNNNAEAAKAAQDKMQEVARKTEKLQVLVNNIPDTIKKGLAANESLNKFNDCLAEFWNTGVYPTGCETPSGTILPQTLAPGPKQGS